jgi:transposase-like protein
MAERTNKQHTEQFKFDIALAAMQGANVKVLCKEFDVVPSQVYEWKDTLKNAGPKLFMDNRCTQNLENETIEQLKKTVETVIEERDFLARAFNRLQ